MENSVPANGQSSVSKEEPRPLKALPNVDKNKVTLTSEIGKGSFGTVYKAAWAGTEVAVKVIKLRNARRIIATLENVAVIIMGVSFLKNSVHIRSELIDGKKLDENLFGEDDDECSTNLPGCGIHA